jgi:hypothetical protein
MLQQFSRAVLIAALTIPAIALQASNASAQTNNGDRRNFTVINNNDLDITHFYVSSIESKTWGDNILNGTLRKGYKSPITFGNESTQCIYDLRVIYENTSCDILRRVNLCTTRSLTLKGGGGSLTRANCR